MPALRWLLLVHVLLVSSALGSAPVPVSFWSLQEPTGAPRVASGAHAYVLEDGDPAAPVPRVSGGVFGAWAAGFYASTPSQRLKADRASVPALTSAIAGPHAVVTLVAWVRLPTAWPATPLNNFSGFMHGFLAGVWGDGGEVGTRQYALYLDLGACHTIAPVYHHGVGAHISVTGGNTPPSPYCMTAACDPRPLALDAWHCLANVYDGATVTAYVNATLAYNGNDNPFPLPGGIFSPEAAGRVGAEFGVGVTEGALEYNHFRGELGGLAVFDAALAQRQLVDVCDGWPARVRSGAATARAPWEGGV